MKFGVNVPNFVVFSDPALLVELAREAEDSGWDGFFIWDHMLWTVPEAIPMADPWVALTAIAASTKRLTIGPMVTPLPRRRHWKVAREAITLDHLSGGRLILGVGIGGDWFGDYSAFGESPDPRKHGEILDEALAVINGLWTGMPFTFEGKHYTVNNVQMLPRPLQQPRIPIWLAGVWPHKKPFRRAARWDGVAPIAPDEHTFSPAECREILAFVRENRPTEGPYDLVVFGDTEAADPEADAALMAEYADADATWWHEGINERRAPLADLRERIRKGPPQIG